MLTSINISSANSIDGWMTDAELCWLAEQAQSHHLIVEVGSYLGRSTRALLDNTEGHVVAVDDWIGPRTGDDYNPDGTPFLDKDRDELFDKFLKNMGSYIDSGKLSIVRTDHSEIENIPALNIHPDFVFIDGDHYFDSVVRDITLWKPKVAPGGILSGHDSNGGGIIAALQHLELVTTTIPGTSIWMYLC